MDEVKTDEPQMRTYNFWVCKQTFVWKENAKGDTRYGRGTLLILPDDETPPGGENRFKKLENTVYREPLEVEKL